MEEVAATWEQLIDDETVEQLVEQVRQADLQILEMNTDIKKLPTKEKIAMGTELKEFLDKARTIHDLEIICNKEIAEQQVEDERIKELIQLV